MSLLSVQADFLGQIFRELFQFESRNLYWDIPVQCYSQVNLLLSRKHVKIMYFD